MSHYTLRIQKTNCPFTGVLVLGYIDRERVYIEEDSDTTGTPKIRC